MVENNLTANEYLRYCRVQEWYRIVEKGESLKVLEESLPASGQGLLRLRVIERESARHSKERMFRDFEKGNLTEEDLIFLDL